MALVLQSGEKELIRVDLHWSRYIVPGAWALLGGMGLLGMLIATVYAESKDAKVSLSVFVMMALIHFLPIFIRWLGNKCKVYAVTNTRVYIEEGIIFKSKIDIPFSKINDITMSEGPIQRLLGSGNISIMTGHSKPTAIKDITSPEVFRGKIYGIVNKEQ